MHINMHSLMPGPDPCTPVTLAVHAQEPRIITSKKSHAILVPRSKVGCFAPCYTGRDWFPVLPGRLSWLVMAGGDLWWWPHGHMSPPYLP